MIAPNAAAMGRRGSTTWATEPDAAWPGLAAAAALAGAIFFLDTYTALASAVAVLYVLVLLVIGECRSRMVNLVTVSGCVVLASTSYVWNHGLVLAPAPTQRFAVSIAAIATTTILMMRNSRSRRLREQMQNNLARMRTELDHAMRFATIGEVSATIAHEVNQPLTAIRTYSEAARRWLAHDPANLGEARAALNDVVGAATRAGEVVKRLRRLSGRAAAEMLPLEVDEMISEAIHLAKREILLSGAVLLLNLEARSAVTLGDRILLQQSLMNLVVNALQAMEQTLQEDRQLWIQSRIVGGKVIITVRDSGPGFADSIAERALEAFATTRVGGMGLGLSICRSTMDAHGGRIEIGTGLPLDGAIVRLILPLTV